MTPLQRIPEQPFTDRAGRPKSWADLQNTIHSLLVNRFPDVQHFSPEVIEDALGNAMMRLMEYWQFLDSSHRGDELNFNYAQLYGTRLAKTLIAGEMAQRRFTLPWSSFGDDQQPRDGRPTDETAWEVLERLAFSPYLTPEEIAINNDEIERSRHVLEDLSPEQLHDWFKNLLTEESEREQAATEGVTQQSIHERRVVRRRHAQRLARNYGLYI